MRITETMITIPKNKINIFKDFTFNCSCKIEDLIIQCNERIPINIRMYFISELLTNYINIEKNLRFSIDIDKNIFRVKKGSKEKEGYSIEDLNLINNLNSLIWLIIDGNKINIIENIEKNGKYYRFYITKKAENILSKIKKEEDYYNMILISNSKSQILDIYIDLISMHFLEGFYRMFPFIIKTPYLNKNEYINNKINLVSKKQYITQQDVENIIKIVKSNTKRINSIIETIMYKINREINFKGFLAIDSINAFSLTQYEKLLSLQVEFRRIENKI